MLKSMHAQNVPAADSEATKTYESMFDQQLSTELRAGNFGIAEALQNQLNLNPSKTVAPSICCQARGYELKQGRQLRVTAQITVTGTDEGFDRSPIHYSSAVRNSQLALSVVSNNIANVNTDGYVAKIDLRRGYRPRTAYSIWQRCDRRWRACLTMVKWNPPCVSVLAT